MLSHISRRFEYRFLKICSVFVIASYLGIGTILFSVWEGWDLMSATYFSFITATSIGFGDLVPLKTFSDHKTITGQIKVIITSVYCIAGKFKKVSIRIGAILYHI